MEIDNNKLDELKDRNPFRVPDGYFESFTEDFMSRLPDKPEVKSEKIPLVVRIKPLLYMAAAFVGLMIFFNVFNKTIGVSSDKKGEMVVDVVPPETSYDMMDEAGEDAEFMEYIKEMYADKYAISYINDFMDY